jgi:hypothetical protein
MLFQVPETKRIMYNTLVTYIDIMLETPLFKSSDRVQCISGPRHCGKTTLIRQLFNNYSDIAFHKEYLDDEDYLTLYEDVTEHQKKIVFIDEVCKASNKAQIKFCTDVKNLQIAGVVVIFTGSTEGVLESLSNSIGRGSIHNIGVLSYVEYLCWNFNIEFGESDKIFQVSSNETFIKYLYSLKESINVNNYITNVITDTCISVSNRNRENFFINKDDILKTIRYLAVQQNTVTTKLSPDIKKYGEIDESIDSILQTINRDYKMLDSKVREQCFELLLKAGILCESKSMMGDTTYIFAYPWILTEYLSKKLFNVVLKPVEDIWVEASIQKRMCEIYSMCGKYRLRDGTREIDILYNNYGFQVNALEIKNAPYENAYRKQKNARDLAKSLNARDYIFTYSHNDNITQNPVDYSIENNKLLLMLEFYILEDKHIGPLTMTGFQHEDTPDLSGMKDRYKNKCRKATGATNLFK